jgi:O-antigen/teichoic acid export membrane protein
MNVASGPALVTGQAKVVTILKLVEYVGLVLFAVIVPRMMGPDLYGRFAAFLSSIALLTIAGGLGVIRMFGRFVPEFQVQKEMSKSQVLFTQVFFVRFLIALLLAVAFFLFFPRLLPKTSTLIIAVGAGAFFLGLTASTFYEFQHGLNNLGKWLSQDSLLKVFLLIGILVLGGGHNLGRAVLSLFLAQLGFFLLGLFWTRSYFTFGKSVLSFSFFYKHLLFGLLFFSANVLLMVVWRSGEVVLLLFSGEVAEVTFYNLANLVIITVAGLIGQLGVMLTPSLTTFHTSGEQERVNAWLGYSLKYLTIASFSFLFIIHIVGPWLVKLVWGKEYLPVVANLKVLALGLLAFPLVRTGVSLAILLKQPVKVLQVTAAALVTFLLAAAILVPRSGSYGVSQAVALALGVAGVGTYLQFSLAQVLAFACFWRNLILGFVALSALALTSTPPLLLGLIAFVLYIMLLFGGKVVSAKEIRRIGQVLFA